MDSPDASEEQGKHIHIEILAGENFGEWQTKKMRECSMTKDFPKYNPQDSILILRHQKCVSPKF